MEVLWVGVGLTYEQFMCVVEFDLFGVVLHRGLPVIWLLLVVLHRGVPVIWLLW